MADNQQQDKLTLEALRNNETRCIRILAACRRFAVNLGGEAGNYATFGQNEEVLLDSFEQVVRAHQDPTGKYDQLFAQRCQKAGLTTADIQQLQKRLRSWQESMDDDEL
jgi:hypothetical protein